MFTSKMKRLLSLALALIMVASMVPFSTFAMEENVVTDAPASEETAQEIVVTEVAEETPEQVQLGEDALYVQSEIDRILTTYLGTTSATKEEIETLVAQMDAVTLMDTQFEILVLEDEMNYMELSAAEQEVLYANNAVLMDLYAVVMQYPMDGVFYTTVKVLGDTLTLTDTQNTIKNNSGTVTATAKGSLFGTKTNTITITNLSGTNAKLSFNYAVTGSYNSYNIAGEKNAASGMYSDMLAAGASITLSVTSTGGLGAGTVTLTLTNISLVAAKDSSNVTFQYDNTLGSVTVGGTAVEPGTQQEIAVAGAELKATAKSGAAFIGWVDDANNQILSQAATYQLEPADDMTVRAIFASTTPWFLVNGNSLYGDLNAAVAAAASATNKTVVLANNGTLPAGDYTIPAGITLLIPCDAANTLYTTTPQTLKIEKYAATPTAYRTLTMASGAKLTVNGAMSISGSMATNTPSPGAVYGAVGFVKMQEGASITVNNGANLYVWGFITGSGSVTIENGGTVYEAFQVTDFRGGNNTSGIVSDDDKYHAFPFNQYYIQNVEVPMTLKAGAVENGYMAVFITLVNIQGSVVPFIGPNGMFNVTEGYIVKDYIESTDRLEISVYGKLQMKSLSISMNLGLAGYKTINSQNFDLPVTNNVTVHVYEGSHMDITQDISFLPGTELIVEKGATGTLGSGNRIIIYDADEWTGKSYAHYGAGADIEPIKYAPGKTLVGKRDVNVDAKVVLGGTIDMDAGAVYSTAGGANVTGLDGAVITMKLPTSTRKAYQIVQTDGWVAEEVPLTSVPLKNADGTTLIANLPDGVYTYANGTWTGECLHILKEAVTTQPTCSTPGVKTFSCACGYSYTEEIATVAHVETDVPAKDATCSAPGLTAGVQCTVCGQFVVAQEEIPALPHTEVIDEAVAATCTTTGLTEGKHCSVCKTVIVAQDEVAALGHSYQSEHFDGVDGKLGYTEYTCSGCGDTYTVEDEAPAFAITAQPTNQNKKIGETATFTVEATGAVSYQWQRIKVGASTWSDISGATEASYSVTVATATVIPYRCVIKDAEGNELITNEVTIILPDPLVNIQNQPGNQHVIKNTVISYTVELDNEEGVTYQWQRCKSGNNWTNVSYTGNKSKTVTFTATSWAQYPFRCEITDANGTKIYTDSYTYTLYEPPIVPNIITNPKDVYLVAGQTATFTVEAVGSSFVDDGSADTGVTYQWWRSKNGGASWGEYTGAGSNTASISVKVYSGQEFLYMCEVKDGYGNTMQSKVAQPRLITPVKITAQPTVTVEDGKATISFTATGDVKTYQWQRLKSGTWSDAVGGSYVGYNTNSLTTTVKATWRCRIVDLAGNITFTDEIVFAG